MNTYPQHSRSIGFWTHHLAMAFRSRVDDQLSEIGLTMGESMPLMLLHHLGPQSLVELSRRMNFAHPSVLRHIDILERKGFVERKPHNVDRRIKVVSLTVTGEELIGRISEILTSVHNKAIVGLTTEEVSTVNLLLRKLFLNLCDGNSCPEEFYKRVQQEVGVSGGGSSNSTENETGKQ